MGSSWQDDCQAEVRDGHMHGVKPLGACLHKGDRNIRGPGLGALSVLPDDTLLEMLQLLSPRDLVRLSAASRALYCFCNHEDLWKALVIQEHEGSFQFQATWKDTYIHMAGVVSPQAKMARCCESADARSQKCRQEKRLQVAGFYSDVLYQGHLCASHPILEHWLTSNLPRRHNLTAEQFREEFEKPNQPVVLVGEPSIQQACTRWSKEYLFDKLKGKSAIAGDMRMLADDFLTYMEREQDDMPLYLFDKQFADQCPDLAADYTVPSVFTEDLFSVLGASRPDYRWLVVGPARSGSSFHIDPNSTIMFPPGSPPPGVFASEDGANVATPVSVVEWFINFYDACQEAGSPFYHGVVNPGEVIFVPHNWWHCVLNLDFSIAITQNFVSAANLPRVLGLLGTRNRELVSGCDDELRGTLFERFVAALRKQRPEVLADWERQQADARQSRDCDHKLAGLFGQPQKGRKGSGGKTAALARMLEGSGTGDSEQEAHTSSASPASAGFKFSFSL